MPEKLYGSFEFNRLIAQVNFEKRARDGGKTASGIRHI